MRYMMLYKSEIRLMHDQPAFPAEDARGGFDETRAQAGQARRG